MASEMRSQTLSGWPSATDSLVKTRSARAYGAPLPGGPAAPRLEAGAPAPLARRDGVRVAANVPERSRRGQALGRTVGRLAQCSAWPARGRLASALASSNRRLRTAGIADPVVGPHQLQRLALVERQRLVARARRRRPPRPGPASASRRRAAAGPPPAGRRRRTTPGRPGSGRARTGASEPIRLAPRSYFCTCWKVRPSSSPSRSWLMPSRVRRSRSRLPTCTSIGLGLLAIRRRRPAFVRGLVPAGADGRPIGSHLRHAQRRCSGFSGFVNLSRGSAATRISMPGPSTIPAQAQQRDERPRPKRANGGGAGSGCRQVGIEHAGRAEAEAGPRSRPQGSTTAEMPVLALRTSGRPSSIARMPRHGEVLVGAGAAPEPGIVGDVEEPGRARAGVDHAAGEDHLVADQRAERRQARQARWSARAGAGLEVEAAAGQRSAARGDRARRGTAGTRRTAPDRACRSAPRSAPAAIEHEQAVPGARRLARQVETLAAGQQQPARRHHQADQAPGLRLLLERVGRRRIPARSRGSRAAQSRELGLAGPRGRGSARTSARAAPAATCGAARRCPAPGGASRPSTGGAVGVGEPQRAAEPEQRQDQAGRRPPAARAPRPPARAAPPAGRRPAPRAKLRPQMPVTAASWLSAVRAREGVADQVPGEAAEQAAAQHLGERPGGRQRERCGARAAPAAERDQQGGERRVERRARRTAAAPPARRAGRSAPRR